MLITLINLAIALAVGIVSTVRSDHPFAVIAITGALLIVLTARGLCEDEHGTQGRALRRISLVLITGLAVISGGWWGFLAFACTDRIVFASPAAVAPAAYVAYAIIRDRDALGTRTVAEILVRAAVVAVFVLLITTAKKIAAGAERRRKATQERLLKTSVSEMNERRINRELSRQSYAIDRNARLLERENISRNIHNSVGHSITAAIMTLDAADMLYDTKPEEARRRMNDANERIRGSLDSIRSAVRALDEESGELPIADLARYLRNAVEDFTMDTERTVDIATDYYAEDIAVPREHVEFLTGVLQEALTNGAKHGDAKHYTVLLAADSAHVRLSVKDDGSGDFNEAVRSERLAAGFGLRKILSYAERCGGTASFVNDGGFRTEVELPLGGSTVLPETVLPDYGRGQ